MTLLSNMNALGLGQTLHRNSNLQNFRTLQFLAEFLFFSKYGQESAIFQQFLIGTEMIKFVLKMVDYHREYRNPHNPSNIFLEKYPKITPAPRSQPPQDKNKIARISKLLEKIKGAAWTKNDYQPEMFQTLQSGKKIQLVTSVQVSNDLKRKRLTAKQMIGQFLLILRPLIAILAIRCFGEESYIPYIFSLAIQLIANWLQRDMTVLDATEALEWEARQRDIVWRCLFKRPFFHVFKDRLIRPALGIVMNERRLLHRIIMYVVEIQSSITLTI